MEAATETTPEITAPVQLFHRFSRYLHIGEGAAECEHSEDGACEDPTHFHAWVRLPNQFERESMRDRATAAKARKLRSLKDPESDARVVMESDLDALRIRGETGPLVEELVNQSFLEDHLQALTDVNEDGEYDTIDEDRVRLQEIEKMPAEEQPEEGEELRKRLAEHTEKVNTARDALQLPHKQSLEGKTLYELVEMIREQRIENVGLGEFNSIYARWEWYIGTLKPKSGAGYPNERVYPSMEAFLKAPPEIIEEVMVTVNALETEQGGLLKGSS
jgi:hypothetical protein